MSGKLFSLLTVIIWSMITLPLPKEASAQIPLTKAVIQSLRNLVRLIPQNQNGRVAKIADAMNPGDSLSTGSSSLAELRFNDGSLARVGAQAVFQFLPNSRTFQLTNGTMLMLIPPGRGQTRLQTPNARTAIRGSALFVRYNPDTETTMVGALTNSNIEVSNQSVSQREGLRAGQLAIIIKDKIEGIYEFDLRTFYETSDLVRGLNLNRLGDKTNPDSAIAQVQSETASAVAEQLPVAGSDVIENPTFTQITTNESNSSDINNSINNYSNSPLTPNSFNISPVLQNPPLEGGEILSNQQNLTPLPPPPVPNPPAVNNPPGNPVDPVINNPPNTPGNVGSNPPANPGTPVINNPPNPPGNVGSNPPGNPAEPVINNPPNPPGNVGSNPPANPVNPVINNPPNTPGNVGSNPPANPGNQGANNPPDSPGNSPNGPPGTVGNPGNPRDNDRPDSPGNSPNGPPGTVGNPRDRERD
ncbi:MAG TPA: FecR domain-containing protein [Leptolyngbyaceae cyanobacterium]